MPVETHKTFGPCTLFNYDQGDIEWLEKLECNVMVCSEEVCPETGKLHLQFSVTFKRSYSFAALKKLHGTISWRAQHCPQDNNYCRKRDSKLLIDRDERKKKGARTDIAEVKDVVRSTCSMRDVVDVASSVQSVRMAELWLKYHEPKRPITPAPQIHWRWGRTDAGKTRYIWDNYGIEEVYTPTSYKWWEGYDGHTVVLIDEIRADWCKFGQLLRLLDRYPYTVEVKGGSRQIKAQTWFITSSKHPKDLYNAEHFDAAERVEQLLRRITTITEVLGTEPPREALRTLEHW